MLFSEWLREHARGDLDREVTEKLHEVVNACLIYEKKGSLTLTLDVDKNGRQVLITGTAKSKVPEPNPEASTWFLSGDGLTRRDPLQSTLPFEEAFKVTDEGVEHVTDEGSSE